MAWFKVDDKLHSHKKAARAGVPAMGLWALAGSWCADQLTNGFIPDYIAARLDPDLDKNAERLVKAELWHPGEHDGDQGWFFHDWDDYQPTREAVEARRESDRERKRKQRRNEAGQYTESQQVSRRDAERNPDGVTPSRPVPSRPDHSSPRRKPERPLPDGWAPNKKHEEIAKGLGIDMQAAVVGFKDHAETNDRRARDWDAAFRTWLRKAPQYGGLRAVAGDHYVPKSVHEFGYHDE